MVRKSPQQKAATAPVVEYEIDLDPGADGNVPMEVDAGAAAGKQRKGRGFKHTRGNGNDSLLNPNTIVANIILNQPIRYFNNRPLLFFKTVN